MDLYFRNMPRLPGYSQSPSHEVSFPMRHKELFLSHVFCNLCPDISMLWLSNHMRRGHCMHRHTHSRQSYYPLHIRSMDTFQWYDVSCPQIPQPSEHNTRMTPLCLTHKRNKSLPILQHLPTELHVS